MTKQEMTVRFTEGPLPPPDILEAYDKVVPNGADRIMSLAERQSQHRQDMEARVIEGTFGRRSLVPVQPLCSHSLRWPWAQPWSILARTCTLVPF